MRLDRWRFRESLATKKHCVYSVLWKSELLAFPRTRTLNFNQNWASKRNFFYNQFTTERETVIASICDILHAMWNTA